MSEVTNNENMRRYVHMALSRQASGGAIVTPQDVEDMINEALEVAIPQWVKNVPIITEEISGQPLEISTTRYDELNYSGAIIYNNHLYIKCTDKVLTSQNASAISNDTTEEVSFVSSIKANSQDWDSVETGIVIAYDNNTDKYYIATIDV